MKKILSIASIAVILFTSTGMTVGFHYCGKLLQEVAWFGKTKPCCTGMEMPVGCCHDQQIDVKSDNFQLTQQTSNIGFVPVLIAEFVKSFVDSSPIAQSQSYQKFSFLEVPRPPGHDIVILVQSFLI